MHIFFNIHCQKTNYFKTVATKDAKTYFLMQSPHKETLFPEYIVRLSLLTMTNPNQLCDVLLLCVLRWLMRPILALNCLLQIEQERSEEESSVGNALALAFRCARFCSASLILFVSYSPAPFLMRPRHFVRVQSVPTTLLVC